jgi:hypothetical protein
MKKVIVTKLVNKCYAFYGTKKFIAVLRRTHLWTISSLSPMSVQDLLQYYASIYA